MIKELSSKKFNKIWENVLFTQVHSSWLI